MPAEYLRTDNLRPENWKDMSDELLASLSPFAPIQQSSDSSSSDETMSSDHDSDYPYPPCRIHAGYEFYDSDDSDDFFDSRLEDIPEPTTIEQLKQIQEDFADEDDYSDIED